MWRDAVAKSYNLMMNKRGLFTRVYMYALMHSKIKMLSEMHLYITIELL